MKPINKAESFLRDRNILLDSEKWPINLSRDTHIHTKNEIVRAMTDFAKLAFKAGRDYEGSFEGYSHFEDWIKNDD